MRKNKLIRVSRKPFSNPKPKRRRAEREAPGKMTMMEWLHIRHEADYKCLCCGKPEPEIKLTRDHVLPLRLGGTNYADNIQPLCAECNSRKGAKHIDYRPLTED